jgi:hypothetical protein
MEKGCTASKLGAGAADWERKHGNWRQFAYPLFGVFFLFIYWGFLKF